MTKMIAFLLALVLLFSGSIPRIGQMPETLENILIPRHINYIETLTAAITHEDGQINVFFFGYKLNNYLWDLEYNKDVVELARREGNDVFRFRVKKFEESSIFIRLCLHGQLYCPEYILKIDIPADEGEDVVYTEYVPGYAKEKKHEGILKAFLKELFIGE